ncbi:hypothetical protein [Methanoregula sp.]|uniref:hypothetical protein n=1 Tax=Methanoregula sp. TaxID=2052170 RepID=UPI003564F5EE
MVLIPFVPERPDILEGFEALKSECKIGIFGSYSNQNKTNLALLQFFLRKNGYENTYLASDLQEQYHQNALETEYSYIHRISNELINQSNILIFVVFNESANEHGINESVLGEMQEANHRGKKNIILYYHKDAKPVIGAYYKTYFYDPPDGWEVYEFNDLKGRYDHVLVILLEMCNRIFLI